jgi:hypothetical protein
VEGAGSVMIGTSIKCEISFGAIAESQNLLPQISQISADFFRVNPRSST